MRDIFRKYSGTECEIGRTKVILVLAYCGLRFGELAALRIQDVGQVRRRLRVEASVTEVKGRFVWVITEG